MLLNAKNKRRIIFTWFCKYFSWKWCRYHVQRINKQKEKLDKNWKTIEKDIINEK